MKKFLAFLIIMAYGFSATGMTISLHYCCGKLKNVTLTARSAKCADHKEGEHKGMKVGPCCETKVIAKQLHEADNARVPAKLVAASYALPAPIEALQLTPPLVERQLSPVAFAPPPPIPIERYLLFGVFRI